MNYCIVSKLYFLFQGYKKVSLDVTSLSNLRWLVFSKYQYEAKQLPPTTSALKCKVCRSHYGCVVLKKSHASKQKLPSPERYGWELNCISLGPVMKDNLLATLALIELSIAIVKEIAALKDVNVSKIHFYELICANVLHAIIAIRCKTTTRKYLNTMNQTLKIIHDIIYLAFLL